MRLRRLAAALSTAGLLVTLAGASGGVAQAGGVGKAGPDLSTVKAAKTYLVSQGFDPSKFVFQVGLKNYAGPSCPGLSWSCTGAARVVQIATASGVNYADCPMNVRRCVIVQGSNAGLIGPLKAEDDVNMHGHCPSGDKEKKLMLKESGSLECTIVQSNPTTGNNHAVAGMSIDDNDGATQFGHEDATVMQSTNGDGDNHTVVHEEIMLHTNDESDQMQDGFQSLNLTQETETGDNFANVKQTQNITARAQSPATEQKQNTLEETDPCTLGPSTHANTCVQFDQSTESGRNEMRINQSHNVEAVGAGGQQNQGCAIKECTLEVEGTQAPLGSTNTVVDDQSLRYTLRGPNGTTQIQDPKSANGPGEQLGGPNDLWKVTQLAVLVANDADDEYDVQQHINQVNDMSTGTVDAQSVIILNGERSEIVCNGFSCNYFQACGFGEGFCPEFSDESPVD